MSVCGCRQKKLNVDESERDPRGASSTAGEEKGGETPEKYPHKGTKKETLM